MNIYPLNEKLELAYNIRKAIPSHPELFANWRQLSHASRLRVPSRLDLAYGKESSERLDLFLAGTNTPLHIFLHGGYWQAMDKADFSFLAEAWYDEGISFAILNYGLCPDVTIDVIVSQARKAWLWLQNHARELGLDSTRFQVSGHSAGGHLAAVLQATTWVDYGATSDMPPIHSVVSVSGLFDLNPLLFTSINEKVGMDRITAERNSPLTMMPMVDKPLILAVGENESTEFHNQSDQLKKQWSSSLSQIHRLNLADCNHLQALVELGRRESDLFRIATELLTKKS